MSVCVSHHNDERSRADKAPNEVCVQTQPAPEDGERETSRMRDGRKEKRTGNLKHVSGLSVMKGMYHLTHTTRKHTHTHTLQKNGSFT